MKFSEQLKKFRAWDRINQRWTPTGDVCISLSGELLGFYVGQMGDDGKYLVVQQFTGLQDKNGTEIYEGDIVRYYDDLSNRTFVMVVHSLEEALDSDGLRYVLGEPTIEVIGNIYENPELLNKT